MPEKQSVEFAVKIAVLRHPETFGLREEDVNPLLQFVLIGAEDNVPSIPSTSLERALGKMVSSTPRFCSQISSWDCL